MTTLALQIVPAMAVAEVVETVAVAESLGYEWCQVADEGLMADVYVALGAAATATTRIRLGAVTNGYTRHPAATAAAIASLDQLSGGRAFVTLVAGGTMVLGPMGIERVRPGTVLIESIQILRSLWLGNVVDFSGRMFRLNQARLAVATRSDIPILVAARGERLLEAAGRLADGIVLMARADLGDSLAVVDSVREGRPFRRTYLDRLAYTPEMVEEAKVFYSYALMDSPDRMLANLGLDQTEIARLRQAIANGGPAAATELISTEMVGRYQITGTREECRSALAGLVSEHHLDMFMINIISAGLEDNIRLLTEVREIVGSN